MTVFWNYITETEIKQIQMLLSDGAEYRIRYRHLDDKSSRTLPCRKTSSATFPAGQCSAVQQEYISTSFGNPEELCL